MPSYENLYQAYEHLPWIAWVPAYLMGAWMLFKAPFFKGMMGFMIAAIFLDGMCAGMWFHLGGAEHTMFGPMALLFILLGDARYFVLMYRYGRYPHLPEEKFGPWPMWLKCVIWTLIPTLTLGLGKLVLPEAFAIARNTYIVYEIVMWISAFLFLTQLLPSWLDSSDPKEAGYLRWLRIITITELAHYGLWIISDALILTGVDAGFGLRFIPDVIYYACFIPVVYFFAPARLKAR